MDAKLMETLRQITDEERKILDGRASVDRTLYTEAKDFTIDSRRMLQRGKLIDVRPHTRFVHFPEHRHNYIEIIFICQGTATHIIDRNHTVTLEAGDLLFLNQHSCHEILPAGPDDIAVNFMVLPEFFDTAFLIHADRTETLYIGTGFHIAADYSDICLFLNVIFQHLIIIQLIYTVTGSNDHIRFMAVL